MEPFAAPEEFLGAAIKALETVGDKDMFESVEVLRAIRKLKREKYFQPILPWKTSEDIPTHRTLATDLRRELGSFGVTDIYSGMYGVVLPSRFLAPPALGISRCFEWLTLHSFVVVFPGPYGNICNLRVVKPGTQVQTRLQTEGFEIEDGMARDVNLRAMKLLLIEERKTPEDLDSSIVAKKMKDPWPSIDLQTVGTDYSKNLGNADKLKTLTKELAFPKQDARPSPAQAVMIFMDAYSSNKATGWLKRLAHRLLGASFGWARRILGRPSEKLKAEAEMVGFSLRISMQDLSTEQKKMAGIPTEDGPEETARDSE
eukprot:Platyproteum_vivax@DN9289_c0_g1_i1.p1